jgi:hypothetical protein
MAYEGEDSKHCSRVEAAKRAVAAAHLKYQRGASVDVVVKADADLASAVNAWYEHDAGVVPDDR